MTHGRRFSVCIVMTLLWTSPLSAQTTPPNSGQNPVRTQESNSSETRRNGAPWRPQFQKTTTPVQPAGAERTGDSRITGGNPGLRASQRTANNTQSNDAPTSQGRRPLSGNVGNQPASVTQKTENSPGSRWVGRSESNRSPDASSTAAATLTRVTRNLSSLPNEAGQVWREYDISPYTSNIKNVEKPEQAVINWILQETGTTMWFHQPLGILSADSQRVYVYHTPEIHRQVRPIIDRFVKTRGQVQAIDLRLVTIGSPNWRAQVYPLLQPIEVSSPGVEAWMVSKENAAILLGALQRRGDYKEHSAGQVNNQDGQTLKLEKRTPVQFIRSLQWTPSQRPNFRQLMSQIQEGYSLEISSLSSLDNRTIEATIECEVDQVEKLQPVTIQVPNNNPVTLQVPQLVSWRLKERIRWPADQVLMLSCGVVASPDPQNRNPLPGFLGSKRRADALFFLEYRGPAIEAERPAVANTRGNLAPIEAKR